MKRCDYLDIGFCLVSDFHNKLCTAVDHVLENTLIHTNDDTASVAQTPET